MHFGHAFNYDTNGVDGNESKQVPPIPHMLNEILLDGLVESGRISEMPDQLTINIYEPGNLTRLAIVEWVKLYLGVVKQVMVFRAT